LSLEGFRHMLESEGCRRAEGEDEDHWCGQLRREEPQSVFRTILVVCFHFSKEPGQARH